MKRQIDIQVLKYSHVILKYMLSQIYIQICNMKKVYHKKVVRQVWKYLIKIRNLILSYYHCLLMKIICPLFKTLISQINWKLYLKYRMFKRYRISSDVFSSHFANQCLKIIQIKLIPVFVAYPIECIVQTMDSMRVKNITLTAESRLDPKGTDFSQSCSGNLGEKNNLCIRTKSGWKGIFWVKKPSIKKRAVQRFSFPLLRFFFLPPLLRRMPRKKGTLRKHSADD